MKWDTNPENSTATWKSILMNLSSRVRFQREDMASSTRDCGGRPLLPSKCSKLSLKMLSEISSANVQLWKL